jgi:FMN-dependent NADH-azoreductase
VKQLLGFIGVTEVATVLVEPTLAADATRQAALEAAHRQAREAVAAF